VQTFGKIIKTFKTNLSDIYPENEVRVIIELVFEHFFNLSKTELFLKAHEQIDNSIVAKLEEILVRLKNHEPIQYIIGQTYFYNCIFKLDNNVLIPRQETEELVEWIISGNKHFPNLKILDIGTGSGCIAISLAKNINNSIVAAADISDSALDLAKQNARNNDVLVNFIKKDILTAAEDKENEQFDIIVSNPPYVLVKEKDKMQKNVLDFEPELALFVNEHNPLLFYDAIVKYSINNLKLNGVLYFEINEAYGNQVAELMINNGFSEIILKKDINGKNRMVSGKKQ
jgi:release factor glutamine methyltransferase